jgi:hypothetical protein
MSGQGVERLHADPQPVKDLSGRQLAPPNCTATPALSKPPPGGDPLNGLRGSLASHLGLQDAEVVLPNGRLLFLRDDWRI